MHICENCEALEEALEVLSKELERQRRRRRELLSTIRLLRQAVVQDMEKEYASENNMEWVAVGDNPITVKAYGLPCQETLTWKSQADGHNVDYPGESNE